MLRVVYILYVVGLRISRCCFVAVRALQWCRSTARYSSTGTGLAPYLAAPLCEQPDSLPRARLCLQSLSPEPHIAVYTLPLSRLTSSQPHDTSTSQKQDGQDRQNRQDSSPHMQDWKESGADLPGPYAAVGQADSKCGLCVMLQGDAQKQVGHTIVKTIVN